MAVAEDYLPAINLKILAEQPHCAILRAPDRIGAAQVEVVTVATATTHAHTLQRRILVGLDLFIGVTAAAGGVGLVLGVIPVPIEILRASLFTSYLIPGLALLAVGIVGLVATWEMFARSTRGYPASVLVGMLMVGYEVVEVAVVGYVSWLQPFYLAIGLATFLLAFNGWRPSETSR